jgi:CHAT domain-containing protein
MLLNILINSLVLILFLLPLSPFARAESPSRLLTKQELLQQLQQAQAYLHQGASNQATVLGEQILQSTQQQKLPELEAIALGILGNTQFIQGNFTKAINYYQVSLQIADSLKNSELLTTAYNNLYITWDKQAKIAISNSEAASDSGNQTVAEDYLQQAINAQAQAKNTAENALVASQDINSLVAAQARLNYLSLLPPEAQVTYREQARQILTNLPPSVGKVYQLLRLAQGDPTPLDTANISLEVAQTIGEPRLLSLAWGELGKIYFHQQKFSLALSHLASASFFAQQVGANDSFYQWQYLTARIHQLQGHQDLAKTSYRQTLAALQTIRQGMASASQDLQVDFRVSVEPVYLNFLELLLESDNPSEIQEALEVADLLQIAFLESFFGDVCWTTRKISPQALSQQTQSALITLLPLPQHVYIILQLPDGSISSHRVDAAPSDLQKLLEQWRFLLEEIAHNRYLKLSQKLYTLLLAPLEAQLQASGVKTLVFNPLGKFRTVPLAALHDGKQFLVQKYAIAHTLSWSLLSQSTIRRHPENNHALIFGLTQGGTNYTPLPGVQRETQAIKKILGDVEVFLNERFTPEKLQHAIALKSTSILHLATHAKFGGTPESSFIQASSQQISLPELEKILASANYPPSLLVLSACQTAAGNERTTLGLAGISLRTGVATVLGSLWFANDRLSAELLSDFYQYNKEFSLAEALKRAQVKQINDPRSHPATWAGFTLWGSWQ